MQGYMYTYFLGIIKWVSLATVYSNTMYWPVLAGWGGIVNMLSKSLKSYISKKSFEWIQNSSYLFKIFWYRWVRPNLMFKFSRFSVLLKFNNIPLFLCYVWWSWLSTSGVETRQWKRVTIFAILRYMSGTARFRF